MTMTGQFIERAGAGQIIRILSLTALLAVITLKGASAVNLPDKVTFTTKVNPVVEKVVHQALKKKMDWFYGEYGYVPYLHYALVDLNGDNKNEVIVRIAERWEFRDRFDNVDTHVFAQTSKGLLQVLEVQASAIAVGWPNHNGLSTIYVYKRPRETMPELYIWDGKRQYVKKD